MKPANFKLLILLSVFFFLLNYLLIWAAPPLKWKAGMKFPKDQSHSLPDVSKMKAMGMSPKAIAKALAPPSPYKLAIIFVGFTSTGTGVSPLSSAQFSSGDMNTFLNDTGATAYIKRLKEYYLEVSYGNLQVNVTALYPTLDIGYTMPSSMSTYGGNNEANAFQLIKDAITTANANGATVNSTDYNGVMVVHCGFGNESTSYDGDIWSLYTKWEGAAGGFTEGTIVAVKEDQNAQPFGVMCHEFGHALGFIDLYNTSSGSSVVGKWDIYDQGTWTGTPQGSSPVHMSSWEKQLMGWISPQEIKTSNTLAINSFENTNANVIKIPVLTSTTEYFLLEYRRKIGHDTALPGEGVLIWHIDDLQGVVAQNDVNNGSIKRVKLMEADKTNPVSESPYGTENDPFRFSTDVFTTPYSNSNKGEVSTITVSNFSGLGGSSMSSSLLLIPVSPELDLKKVFGFPNPSSQGAPVVIRTKLTRPVSSGTVSIYNVSGELILKQTLSNDNLNITASQSEQSFVYDYIWNLKNSAGSLVSSGIYIALIETQIDSEKKIQTKKIAVIR